MKNILVISGIAVAGLFWACGDGTIATKSGDDEMALLNYGEFNPGGMSGLVGEALKACQEDPKCAEAMANSDVVVPADTDTKSSDASTDTSSSTTDSTGTKPSANSSSGATPASATGSSSSATEPSGNSSSSANVAPGSSSATTSSSSAALPTKIRGACSGTSPAEKNTDVKWTFANLTPALKPKSFKWTFDEGASKLSSTDESPVVQYTTPNMLKGYGATLVVDEGLETESDPIPCTVVKITGIQVKDCECTASATTVVASESKPKDVTWTVDKCSGGTSFTYEWSNGASGAGASTTVSVKSGSITPKVTITNEDGMNMTRTCPTVTVTEPTEITSTGCAIKENNNTNYFKAGDQNSFSGWNTNKIGQTLNMDLYLDNTKLGTKPLQQWSGDYWYQITLPTDAGNYVYHLEYLDNTVCSVNYNVDLIKPSCNIGPNSTPSRPSYTSTPEQTIYFKPGKSNYPGGETMSMTLMFNGESLPIEVKPNNNTSMELTAPINLGDYTIALVYGGDTVCTAILTVDETSSSGCQIVDNPVPQNNSNAIINGPFTEGCYEINTAKACGGTQTQVYAEGTGTFTINGQEIPCQSYWAGNVTQSATLLVDVPSTCTVKKFYFPSCN